MEFKDLSSPFQLYCWLADYRARKSRQTRETGTPLSMDCKRASRSTKLRLNSRKFLNSELNCAISGRRTYS